jgi:hypothetical protein
VVKPTQVFDCIDERGAVLTGLLPGPPVVDGAIEDLVGALFAAYRGYAASRPFK